MQKSPTMPKQSNRSRRSASEKRKPSTSPTDSLPAKTTKPLLQKTLFFQTSADDSPTSSKDTPRPTKDTPKPSKDTPTPSKNVFSFSSTPMPGSQDSELFSPTPSPSDRTVTNTPPYLENSVFNFINEASTDVLTSKLSKALMLPQLQEKFQVAFMKVATELMTEHVRSLVEPLQREVAELKKEIAPLKQEVSKLRGEIERKTDDLEQYSRRNSVRISGLKEEEAEEQHDTVKATLKILKKVDSNISRSDIDRCHRVGRKVKGKDRQIIVKFVSYWDRNSVITNRRKLLDHKVKGVYINEDLTQFRSRLFKRTRDLQKAGSFYRTWTRDGRIYIEEQQEGRTRVISCDSDLDPYTPYIPDTGIEEEPAAEC